MRLDNLIEDAFEREADAVELDTYKQNEILTFIESHGNLQKRSKYNLLRDKFRDLTSRMHLNAVLAVAVATIIVACIPIAARYLPRERQSIVVQNGNKTGSERNTAEPSQACASSEVSTADVIAIDRNKPVSYKVYTDSKFGFSVEYPSIFAILSQGYSQEIPSASIFMCTSDKAAQFSLNAENNVNHMTAEIEYNNLISETKNVFYKRLTVSGYEYAYVDDNFHNVWYEKAAIGSGSINRLHLVYPEDQKDYYEPIAKHILDSFKTPNISTSIKAEGSTDHNNPLFYRRYTDNICGFSVDYPAYFKEWPRKIINNGDYISLQMSSNGYDCVLSINAYNNNDSETPEKEYQGFEANNSIKKFLYKRQTDNGYEFAWVDDSMHQIWYEKYIIGSGSVNEICFYFPEALKEDYQPIAEHIFASFETPNIDSKFKADMDQYTSTSEAGTNAATPDAGTPGK